MGWICCCWRANHDVEPPAVRPLSLPPEAADPGRAVGHLSNEDGGGVCRPHGRPRHPVHRPGPPQPGEQHAPAGAGRGGPRFARADVRPVRCHVAPRDELSPRPTSAEGSAMQKITVLCVGKLKEKFYLEAAGGVRQAPAAATASWRSSSCRRSKLPDDPSPAQIEPALEQEAAAIRAKAAQGVRRWSPCASKGRHLLQRGAEPPEAAAAGPCRRQEPAHLSHRRQRGPAPDGPEAARPTGGCPCPP